MRARLRTSVLAVGGCRLFSARRMMIAEAEVAAIGAMFADWFLAACIQMGVL